MKQHIFSFPFQLFLSVVLAVVLGLILGPLPYMDYTFKQIGGIFVDGLKVLVVPLAFVSITSATIKLGEGKLLRFSYRFITLAVLISLVGFALGFFLMNLFPLPALDISGAAVKQPEPLDVLGFIRKCIPVNPIQSLSSGNMLQIITLCFLVSLACFRMKERAQIVHGLDVIQQICVRIANMVMRLAPIGVFCLLYPVVTRNLSGLMTAYLQMAAVLAVGSLIYMMFCSIPLLYFSKIESPLGFFRLLLSQDIVGSLAGGSTNYLAPRIARLKKDGRLNNDVIDFFLPMTAILTRVGSAICVGIYTVFASSVFHISLSWEQIVFCGLLSFIALMCAPGIIGGTLMDCAIIWAAVGIPIEAVAYLASIDYLMDLLRTVLNVQGGEIITACMNKYSFSLSCSGR